MRRPVRRRNAIRPHILAALMALAPALAGAMDYTITTTADAGDGNCTLREALQAADTNLAVDECPAGEASDKITLLPGTYLFFPGETLSGTGSLEIYGSTLDPFDVTIELTDQGRFLSLFSGSGTTSYVLGGIAIVDGVAPGSEQGGAIYAANVSLKIFNFRFVENDSTSQGGALYFSADHAGADLELDHGSFISNRVTAAGAAYGGAAYVSTSTGAGADFRDVTFLDNSVTGSSFPTGGALRLDASGTGAIATCVRCHFEDNFAVSTPGTTPARGGALTVFADLGAHAEILDSSFTGNYALGDAAALKAAALAAYASSGAALLLERLFVDYNGGTSDANTHDVELYSSGPASTLALFDSQVTFGAAGGLVASSDAALLLGHLTIADYPLTGANLASFSGDLALQNSIVSFNGTDLSIAGTVAQTTNFIGGDPLFADEPSGDYHLSASSPPIDAGSNDAASVRFADLDHGPRIVGPLTDIGCYERGSLFADNFEVGDTGSWSSTAP